MLRTAKTIYGNKLGATDGEIGHVRDFYFNDEDWMIRYLVVDTGDWLPGRQVLIPPHVVASFGEEGKIVEVNLSRARIENSPAIATHKPVSRQYEEEYYRYFGWPSYWMGETLPAMPSIPASGTPSDTVAAAEAARSTGDAHLRSTRAVEGYHVQGTDRLAGHVSDFRINPETWRICKLRVRVGHRLSGTEVDVSTNNVLRISYMDSAVFVDRSGEEVESGISKQAEFADKRTPILSLR